MRAGDLRHTLLIQRKVGEGKDDYGAPVQKWKTVRTVRAAIEPISGREFFARDQRQADVTTRIRLRYVSGIEAAMRAKSGCKLYDIKAVLDQQGKGRELHLMCSDGVSDG